MTAKVRKFEIQGWDGFSWTPEVFSNDSDATTFESLEEAIQTLASLRRDLGWEGKARVVEVVDQDEKVVWQGTLEELD